MLFNIKINNFIKKIFILQILCLKVLFAQEIDFQANPEKSTGMNQSISSANSKDYMIVCADIRAAEAAKKIIEMGGNAIDAVIAAQNVLSVVEPQSSGLGGGGFLLFFNKKYNKLEAWDGREFAPSSANKSIFLNPDNSNMKFLKAINTDASVGIPGLYNMLADAHHEHGIIKWNQLFQDSLIFSRGFIVSKRLNKLLNWATHVQKDKYAMKIYFNKDKPKKVGEIVNNEQLYISLKDLSQNPYSIKDGNLAKSIANKVKHKITLKDLKSWKTIKRNPICMNYYGYSICGFPPPTSGGVGVLQILGILKKFKSKNNLLLSQHLFLESSRLAYSDRDTFIADPDFFEVPLTGLLTKNYLLNRANEININKANHNFSHGNPSKFKNKNLIRGKSTEKPSTTHISVIDKYGNAAALTSSIEFAFGSGKTVGGFFLNNQLTDFSFDSFDENKKKVANSISPLKKPRSTMSPTMVFDNNRIVGVLGSPGGSRIICYVAKTLYYLIYIKESPVNAIFSPHICSRNTYSEIEDRVDADDLAKSLQKLGHKVTRKKMTSGINLIWKHKKSWVGTADPRREGVALAND